MIIFTLLISVLSRITLINFNNSNNWVEINDPVMGGMSTGSFTVNNTIGIFSGNCVNVPSLNAPGFCRLTSKKSLFSPYYPDISVYLNKSLSLRLKTNTSEYQGFRIAFTAKNIPRTSIYSSGSFKAGFSQYLQPNDSWQIVSVPFSDFSYDWSAYTGRCNTTDPTGVKHHCCLASNKYCPKAKYLKTLTGFEIWAEGTLGQFYLELDWIGVI